MSILVTSAGRRVALIRAIQADAAEVVPGAQVLAADLNPSKSAACAVADDRCALPRVDDDDYVGALLELCSRRHVSLVIPTIDHELPIFATHREVFAERGVHVIVSDLELVCAATDKRQTPALFGLLGVPTPSEVPVDALKFPVFVKPFDGSASEGIVLATSEKELPHDVYSTDKYIVQEYVDPRSHDEFTCDLYYDVAGHLKCLVPRLRIETRAGEVSKGLTVRDALYERLVQSFAWWPGARGCVTVQLFASKDRHSVLGIEVNPRFGGGFPLSYQAGARFPAWLLREYLLSEEVPFYDEWEENLLMLRFDEGVFRSGVGGVSGQGDCFRPR